MHRRIAWLRPTESTPTTTPSPRVDRLMRGLIFGGGVFVFALFAWGHLGLGAWLFPPAASAAQQTAKAGPYVVTLELDAGQLTVGEQNRASVLVRDAAGHPVEEASVHVQPVMTTMAMNVPAAQVVANGNGRFTIGPVFSMAGVWRLDLAIAAPGQATQHVSFDVGVRWK